MPGTSLRVPRQLPRPSSAGRSFDHSVPDPSRSSTRPLHAVNSVLVGEIVLSFFSLTCARNFVQSPLPVVLKGSYPLMNIDQVFPPFFLPSFFPDLLSLTVAESILRPFFCNPSRTPPDLPSPVSVDRHFLHASPPRPPNYYVSLILDEIEPSSSSNFS